MFLAVDGKSLVHLGYSPQGNLGYFVSPLAPKGSPRPLFSDSNYAGYNADISPDGRWMAYDSNESGQSEVYVRPFPAVESRPVWSRSGRELFFVTAADKMAVAAVRPAASFEYSKAQVLFDIPVSYRGTLSPFRTFDVSADGKRFLMLKNLASADTTQRRSIVVVQNWFVELKTRMPARP
jgi:serine/threonine-protein kinase